MVKEKTINQITEEWKEEKKICEEIHICSLPITDSKSH